MYPKFFLVPLCLLVLLVSSFGTLQAATPVSPDFSADPGYQAFTQATKANKYLMVHLYSGTPEQAMENAYIKAHSTMKETLNAVSIDLQNTGAGFLIEKYKLKYAPVPIVIIIAPNGVVSGSFRSSFSPEQVESTFQTPKTLQCLLAFQERRLVFISAQGKETTENNEALDGITRFGKENPLYGKLEMILIDPKDSSESALLAQLKVQPDIKKAQTFLLVPPGRIVGRWAGATDPGEFVKRLNSLAKSCSTPSCVDPTCK